MPLSFSSSDRNSDGSYSISSGRQTGGSSSSSSAPAYSGPGSSSFNNYYNSGGGYQQNLGLLSSGGGYDGNGSSSTSTPEFRNTPAPTYTASDGTKFSSQTAADAYDSNLRSDRNEVSDQQAAERRNDSSRQERNSEGRRDAPFSGQSRGGLAAGAGYANANPSAGITPTMDVKIGLADLDHTGTDFRDQYGTTLSTYTDAEKSLRSRGYGAEADQVRGLGGAHAASVMYNNGNTYYRDGWRDASDDQRDAMAKAGDMQTAVMLRNAPGDGVGPINPYQTKFAGTDSYAANLNTVADTVATGADMLLPLPISPFSGAVDASQGNDMSQWYYNEDSSAKDKWMTAAKTAAPFGIGRMAGGLLGEAQYDSYGKVPDNVSDYASSDDYINAMGLDPNSEEAKAVKDNWDYWQGYDSHLKGMNNNNREKTYRQDSVWSRGRATPFGNRGK